MQSQLTSKIFYASVTSNSAARIQDKNNKAFSMGQSDWLILIYWEEKKRVNNTSPKLVAPYTTAHQLSKGAATLKPFVLLSICCLEFQSLGKETIHSAQPDWCVSALTHNLTQWARCFWVGPKQHERDGSVDTDAHKPEFILLFFLSLWAFHSLNCLFSCHHAHHYIYQQPMSAKSSGASMSHFITISSPVCSHDPLPSPFHHLFAATTHFRHHFITYMLPDFSSHQFTIMLSRWEVTPPNICTKGK